MLEEDQKQELVKYLCSLAIDIKSSSTLNGINTANMITNQSDRQNWTSFVQEAIMQSSTDKNLLLNFLNSEVQTYPDFSTFIEYIENKEFNRNLDSLFESIKSQRVVLFLGNNFLKYKKDGQSIPFNKGLSEHLFNRLINENYSLNDDIKNNLLITSQKFHDKIGKTKQFALQKEANEFFKVHENSLEKDIYTKISQLPFQMIINLNYDNILTELLINEYEYKEYRTANDGTPFTLNSSSDKLEKVLINLFGSLKEKNDSFYGCILTEMAFVDFFSNLLGSNIDIFKKTLKNHYNYLFLGFDFDQWYVKILLNILIKRQKGTQGGYYSRFAVSNNISSNTQDLLQEHYNFYFFNEKDTEIVVDTLISKL